MTIWEVGDDEKAVEGLDEDGNPDPAYATALGLIRAPFGRRAGAAVIDVVIYLLLQVPYWVFGLPLILKLYFGRISVYGLLNHPQLILAIVMTGISFVLTLAYSIVQLVMHGRKGVTVGKGLMGLRSVNVKTLERPGFWRIVLRAVVLWGSALVVIGPILFMLSPLLDPLKRGRGWHDLVGQNWYVDVRKGLQPYDEKRMRIARKTVTVAPAALPKEMPSLATPVAQGAAAEYRPGGRVSAGVLGVARPHGAGPRPEVGLTGLDPQSPAPAPAEAAPGRPVMGGYRPGAPGDQANEPAQASGPDMSSGGPPAVTPPAPTYAPEPPAVPVVPPPRSEQGGMVTGTPWGAPEAVPAQQAEPAPAQPQAPRPQPEAAPAQPPPTQEAEPAPAQQVQQPDGSVSAVPADVEQTRMPMSGHVLYLDDGAQVPVTESVVLGRDPSPGATGARPVRVADQSRSVSKTHLVLRPTEVGVEVTDLGSTNGTAVVHEGREHTLAPGSTVLAVPGDTVRFGERTAVVGHS